jgi:hypothetical protein
MRNPPRFRRFLLGPLALKLLEDAGVLIAATLIDRRSPGLKPTPLLFRLDLTGSLSCLTGGLVSRTAFFGPAAGLECIAIVWLATRPTLEPFKHLASAR